MYSNFWIILIYIRCPEFFQICSKVVGQHGSCCKQCRALRAFSGAVKHQHWSWPEEKWRQDVSNPALGANFQMVARPLYPLCQSPCLLSPNLCIFGRMSVATTAQIPSRKHHWNMAKPGTQVQSVQSLQGFTLHCWPMTPIYCGWFWFRLATLDKCWGSMLGLLGHLI